MANSYVTNPIYLDDFSAIIDLCVKMNFATGTPFRVRSIEWANPTAAGDLALITDKVSGTPVFKEYAFVAHQPVINYYDVPLANLYIAISGIASGYLLITLE
jgi:hypothetical protein